jgi:heme/copper-type cytochrome/quinol oxidase subunit 4
MVTGIASSLILPKLLSHISLVQGLLQAHPVNSDVALVFPLTFAISVVGCLAGTWLTAPENDEVLKDFYRRVRPWGFWSPILAKVRAEDPAFERNKDFWRDMFNIVVGITWQVSLVALPMYIVIQKFRSAAITAAIIAVTSIVLKFTWYNHLKAREAFGQANLQREAAQRLATA